MCVWYQTGVDKRQKLMDRYNNDTRIFCFILSTRSGGLGMPYHSYIYIYI